MGVLGFIIYLLLCAETSSVLAIVHIRSSKSTHWLAGFQFFDMATTLLTIPTTVLSFSLSIVARLPTIDSKATV